MFQTKDPPDYTGQKTYDLTGTAHTDAPLIVLHPSGPRPKRLMEQITTLKDAGCEIVVVDSCGTYGQAQYATQPVSFSQVYQCTPYPDPDYVSLYRCELKGCKHPTQDGSKFCRKHLHHGRK